MARIRTIKPEFWKNERLGEMKAEVQLLFIGLWNLCDRRGFLEDRPKRIKAELFPYRKINIDNLLNELNGEFINRIQISDKQYIHIINFTKHQVCNIREPESTVPEQYWNSTRTVPESQEGKGREGKRKGMDNNENFDFDFMDEKLVLTFKKWIAHRIELKKPIKTQMEIESCYTELMRISGNNVKVAIDTINRSIGNGWKSLVEIEVKQKPKQEGTVSWNPPAEKH